MTKPEVAMPKLPKDQEIIFGRPKTSPDKALVKATMTALELFPSFIEAHMPQYFSFAQMEGPRLMLAVVAQDADIKQLAVAGRQILNEHLPPNHQLDMWVIGSQDHLLPAIRRTHCRLR